MSITDSKSQEDTVSNSSDRLIYECYLADGNTHSNGDGIIEKDILREGEWAYRPGPGQRPVKVPLKVVPGHSEAPEEVGMQDIIEAFEEGAIENVTIPLTHDDRVDENTGYVRSLKIQERDGKHVLTAGLEFTEPDIKEKIERKTIANTSAGIMFDYIKKDSGKKFRKVLGHVALTNKPWLNGVKPFGVAASEHFAEEEIVSVVERDTELEWLKHSIEAFGPSPQHEAIKRHIIERAEALEVTGLLPEAWIENSANSGAEKTAHSNDTQEVNNMGDVNKEVDSGETSEPSAPDTALSPDALNELEERLRTEFQEKLDAKDKTIADQATVLDEQGSRVREMTVDKRVKELGNTGLSEFPGLLAEIRNIMLADKGGKILTLSEKPSEDAEEVEVNLSISEVVERFINALPSKDGRVALSEQANEVEDHSRPDKETNLSEDERVEKLAESLGIELPSKDGDN